MNDTPGKGGARVRTYAWQDWAEVARQAQSLTGLDFLRKVKAGEIRAPIQDTLDFRLDDVGEGWSRWILQPDEFQYNPVGQVHGGVISTLLDTAMGVALWTTLPQGAFGSTIELKVNFVRPVTRETGPISCEAKVIHSGRSIGTAEGRVTDAGGKLLAHGSTTCLATFPGQKR